MSLSIYAVRKCALLKQSTNGGFYFSFFISVSCSTCNDHHRDTHFISNAKERKKNKQDKSSTFTFIRYSLVNSQSQFPEDHVHPAVPVRLNTA
jgi:hypothetical protein